jgi:hypothetical protein
MIVIAHQDVAVKAKMKVFYCPTEQFQKPLSVPVVPKDSLSLIASGRDVVVRSRIFYPQWPGHEGGFLPEEIIRINRPDPDLARPVAVTWADLPPARLRDIAKPLLMGDPYPS